MNYTGNVYDEEVLKAARAAFSEEELELLSTVIVLAIQRNNDAAKLSSSQKAVADLASHNAVLQHLNTKICAMMEDEQ